MQLSFIGYFVSILESINLTILHQCEIVGSSIIYLVQQNKKYKYFYNINHTRNLTKDKLERAGCKSHGEIRNLYLVRKTAERYLALSTPYTSLCAEWQLFQKTTGLGAKMTLKFYSGNFAEYSHTNAVDCLGFWIPSEEDGTLEYFQEDFHSPCVCFREFSGVDRELSECHGRFVFFWSGQHFVGPVSFDVKKATTYVLFSLPCLQNHS